MRRILAVIAVLVLLCLAAFWFLESPLFPRAWPHVLMLKSSEGRADCLILLGGEQEARPVKVAELYRDGLAPRIFITGDGDFAANKKRLLASGVPESAITIEESAKTTLQNARLLRPMLEKEGVKSALIVTSPFHMRRALAVFQHEIPGVRFAITQTSPEYWGTKRGKKNVQLNASLELVKVVYYWAVFGVKPWGVEGRVTRVEGQKP